MEQVEKIKEGISNGVNPMEYKKLLALQIVSDLNNPLAAQAAQQSFEQTFSKGGVPEDIKTVATKGRELVDILLEEGLITSKSEFTRLNKEGEIKEIENGVYRVGKHRFIKIERD